MLRDAPSTDDAAWTVETARNAVLAGDIDDLHEIFHVERANRRR